MGMGGSGGSKTWKIKCFQFIQSKISQFVTQMWLPKKLQFLVPGTPPDPPNTPLDPPRGPGEPKMAKMHSLKSNNDNKCQKSHFRGVENFDLFFHSECTSCLLDPHSRRHQLHIHLRLQRQTLLALHFVSYFTLRTC